MRRAVISLLVCGLAAGCKRSEAAPASASAATVAEAPPPPPASASGPAPSAASAAPPAPPPAPPLAPPPDGDPGCPPGMARVGTAPKPSKAKVGVQKKPPKPWGFCVDRWEAHLVRPEGEGAVLHPHNERPVEGLLARAAPGVLPQGYISRVEAQAACKAAGKRLCSRGEWQRACRGLTRRSFPYGHAGQRGRCNNGKVHLLGRVYGNDRRRWTYEAFNDPKLDAEPGFLEPGGTHERCATPEQVFDMVGNLHEWVSTDVTEELVEMLEQEPFERKKQPWKKGNGIFMGGFFSTTDEHGPGCNYTTIAHEPRYHDYSTGFRCCADPAAE